MTSKTLYLASSEGMAYDIYAVGRTPEMAFALWCQRYERNTRRQFRSPGYAFHHWGGRITPMTDGNAWDDGNAPSVPGRREIERILRACEQDDPTERHSTEWPDDPE